MSMDQKIKGDWVAALRSGEYKQGTEFLHQRGEAEDGSTVDLYCCLGVLSKLAADAGVVSPVVEPYSGRVGPKESVNYGQPEDEEILPAEVAQWAELVNPWTEVEYQNPKVACGEGRVWLSELNDSGMTFAEIADLIEKDEDL